MKKNIFILFIISMMTGFLITCTLSLANEVSEDTDQAQTQESVDRVAELSMPAQLPEAKEPDQTIKNDISNLQEPEVPPSIPIDNYDSVELSVAQIIEKAEQGDIYVQYDLAFMYANGKGVPQDNDQAASWILKAANRGHLQSQQHLASLYESGKWGFPKDKDKAAYWSKLRGRLPSSTTGNQDQEDNSKMGVSFSGFTLFAVFIVFALIAIVFIINKKKIKTTEPAKPATITLDFLESQADSESESDIKFDDLTS